MNASSVDIADMLVDESGLGLTIGTNLFVGEEPAKPDDCVTIFDTQGFPPYLGLTEQGYYYPSVQIRVRSNVYRTGYTLMNDIMVSLHGRAQETRNGTLYSVIYASGDPGLLGWDENHRCWFITNFNLQRR